MKNVKKYISEFMGTYGLVFFGTGAIIVNDFYGGYIGHLGISISFGLVVMAMIYSFGEISGAHFNPAVTFAFWLSGRFPGRQVAPYLLSQILGAIGASLTLLFLFPAHPNFGTTQPSAAIDQTFVLEVILSFFLMLVIINVSTGSKELGVIAGIAIGAVVLLEALFAGPITGASMNPARSIAPALISGNLEYLWIYLCAPLLGTSMAVMGCKSVKEKDCCPGPTFHC